MSPTSPADTVIIVGAPRSGTNMLRDVLTGLDGFETWPCDEINPIWHHGNPEVRHDELKPEQARPEVRRFIRQRFDRFRAKTRADVVVEKTCATSLRVGFADAVFPDAKFVFIHRNGIDAAISATKRWNAKLDLGYTLRKARWVPAGDLVRQCTAFAQRRLRQLRSGPADPKGAASTWWGPQPHDYQELRRSHPVDELAAIQWSRCVDASLSDLNALDPDRWIDVDYQRFVTEPAEQTQRILGFLGREGAWTPDAVASVRTDSVGLGRGQLPPADLDRLAAITTPTLDRLAAR